MWVRFEADFRWAPESRPRTSLRYKAGCRYNVPTPCAQEAIASGAAKRCPAKKRPA